MCCYPLFGVSGVPVPTLSPKQSPPLLSRLWGPAIHVGNCLAWKLPCLPFFKTCQRSRKVVLTLGACPKHTVIPNQNTNPDKVTPPTTHPESERDIRGRGFLGGLKFSHNVPSHTSQIAVQLPIHTTTPSPTWPNGQPATDLPIVHPEPVRAVVQGGRKKER